VHSPEPAWARIRSAREVVLVPDGPLSLLPFEALVTGASGSGSPRFWLDEGPPIRYTPSATLLREIGGRGTAGAGTALSVFNPSYGSLAPIPALGPLPALPGTSVEADRVRSALSGLVELRSLQGPAARESAVRALMSHKRWIHLATHGLVDEQGSDLFAALAFAPESSAAARGDDDGLLELHEIYDLTLDSDLVVLSACRSNAGRHVTGEGVFALSRGFLVAGARRVVSSQWSVADESTAELIGDFFQEIASAERGSLRIDYARALRDAKLRLRARPDFAHPFHWAAFVLTGAE
jgi:CHAT domain-containing protein